MRKPSNPAGDMLQGTLDMLILQTLLLGAAHGHSIAHAIEKGSEDVLQVEHGSLFTRLYTASKIADGLHRFGALLRTIERLSITG